MSLSSDYLEIGLDLSRGNDDRRRGSLGFEGHPSVPHKGRDREDPFHSEIFGTRCG